MVTCYVCHQNWTHRVHFTYHLNSLNRDNQQFFVSLPCNILRNVLRNKKVVISSLKCEDLSYMLFRMPSEDLHIAAKFDPVLSRLSESRCYENLTHKID